MLLQHSYAVLTQEAVVAQYLQAGLLSVSYFVIAWVAHTLAKYAIASEKLAALRGVDLANMAEANRLVIQDMPDGVSGSGRAGSGQAMQSKRGTPAGFRFSNCWECDAGDVLTPVGRSIFLRGGITLALTRRCCIYREPTIGHMCDFCRCSSIILGRSCVS